MGIGSHPSGGGGKVGVGPAPRRKTRRHNNNGDLRHVEGRERGADPPAVRERPQLASGHGARVLPRVGELARRPHDVPSVELRGLRAALSGGGDVDVEAAVLVFSGRTSDETYV